jgi:hypothetical protein
VRLADQAIARVQGVDILPVRDGERVLAREHRAVR